MGEGVEGKTVHHKNSAPNLWIDFTSPINTPGFNWDGAA